MKRIPIVYVCDKRLAHSLCIVRNAVKMQRQMFSHRPPLSTEEKHHTRDSIFKFNGKQGVVTCVTGCAIIFLPQCICQNVHLFPWLILRYLPTCRIKYLYYCICYPNICHKELSLAFV